MKITSVRIIPVENDHKLKAYVSIIIDSCFAIHDLKIIQKDNKMFVAMPSKKIKKQDLFKDIAHPLDSATRNELESIIFNEYKQMTESQNEEFFKKASKF